MTTQFVDSTQGFQIAYDVQGSGPALLLAHGFNNDRTMWHEQGWVDYFQGDYTVIAMDVRGCGESSASAEPTDYSPAAHLADVEAVLNACGVAQCLYWGWSFGATIGTHLAAHTDRLQRAVIAGTSFGPLFRDWHDDNIQIAAIAKAKREGRLDELGLDDGRRRFAETMDLDRFWARRYALEQWPGVEPADLRCPTLIYTGTNDHRVVPALRQQQSAIDAAGQRLYIFDRLDHRQLASELTTVAPVVEGFLYGAA